MKKLLTFALALSLVCCLASCNNSDENSKTAELEKRVAELESQINEQSITTTTTTTATTTTASSQTTTTTTTKKTTTTTTTAQTFDTSYREFDNTRRRITKYEINLYAAPDKNSEILYTCGANTILDTIGNVDDWEAVLYNGELVFVDHWSLTAITSYDEKLGGFFVVE